MIQIGCEQIESGITTVVSLCTESRYVQMAEHAVRHIHDSNGHATLALYSALMYSHARMYHMYLNTAAGKAQNADLPKDVSPSIARLYLNELVEKARIELNDMIFVCKRHEGLYREFLGKAQLQWINQVGGLSCSLTEKQQQLTRSY